MVPKIIYQPTFPRLLLKLGPMVAADPASGKDETGFWPYGRGFGIQTDTDGQIEPDFSLSGHTSPSVISEGAPSFRLLPGVIDAIHRSPAGFPETDCGARRLPPSGT